MQFNLTGPKTWHHLAPYFGAGFGLAFGSHPQADTTSYRFGTKLYASPNVGLRIFLTDRLNLRLEARRQFWKIKYPATWTTTPLNDPSAPAVISGTKLTEWTNSGWWMVGGSWSF